MVKQFTGYRSTTGKPFDTEFEAWSEELRDFLVKHGADNDAIARKIVQAVVDGQPETLATLADIVENMDRCAPEVVRDALALDEWDKDAAETFCTKCNHRHGVKDRCRVTATGQSVAIAVETMNTAYPPYIIEQLQEMRDKAVADLNQIGTEPLIVDETPDRSYPHDARGWKSN